MPTTSFFCCHRFGIFQAFNENILLLLKLIQNSCNVILQLQADASIGNPYGCWNWNGYLGDFENAFYGAKDSVQINGIFNMIQALIKP